MMRSATLSFGLILPVFHIVFLASTASPPRRSTKGQDGVPLGALRAYLHDRAEPLGSAARLLLCPGIVAPTAERSLLEKELGTAVALMSDCSSAQGRIDRDARGQTLLIRRSMIAGDSLILQGEGMRQGIANSGPTEFTVWGERVALLRRGASDAWFVVSITLTGVERAMDRRPPRAPAGYDSTNAVATLRLRSALHEAGHAIRNADGSVKSPHATNLRDERLSHRDRVSGCAE